MALKWRLSDAEYVERIRRFEGNRWIWGTLMIVLGVMITTATVWFIWFLSETNLGGDGFDDFGIGFDAGLMAGAVVANGVFYGLAASLAGIVMGVSDRKNRLLIRYYDMLVADELESNREWSGVGETASGG